MYSWGRLQIIRRLREIHGRNRLEYAYRFHVQPTSGSLKVLYQLFATALCAGLFTSHPAFAGAPSCSSPDAVSTVMRIEKEALGNIAFYRVFDFEASDFSLINIRTEDGNAYKLQCAATLIGDPQAKSLGDMTEKDAQVMRKMLSGSFTSGLPLHYTVQNTDDGKIYVELLTRSGG